LDGTAVNLATEKQKAKLLIISRLTTTCYWLCS